MKQNIENYVRDIVRKAKEARYELFRLNTQTKNTVLLEMAESLLQNKDYILAENKKDVICAGKNKITKSYIDRLTLSEKRLTEMSLSLKEIAALPDPIYRVIDGWRRPNDLFIQKVKVPIGVILAIYEARPNVTSDCIGLMFKSSNVGILRGGSDAFYSNSAIGKILMDVIKNAGISFSPFFIIEKTEYNVVDILLKQNEYIDLVIPRGGEGLIRRIVEHSRIPVIKHYKGVCSVFVDKTADMNQALKICVNAKVQRPSVCNAAETILVHQNIAKKFLPLLKKEFDKNKVQIRGDSQTQTFLKGIRKAVKNDWSTEFLDLIVAVKVVKDVDAAVDHINTYGSHHTDTILTQDLNNARVFVRGVDSACCFVNISTRFSDGYQFGLGAEIGISTDKLHARGPMGLDDLTTYKYVVEGNGQIRT